MEFKTNFAHKSLSSKVEEYLKEQILLEKYRGGERILESNIAEELNISRAPVREAITKLENQGIVQSIPRKGSFVVEFSKEDIKEIYDIRIILENRIMNILIRDNMLSGEDYNKLERIIDEMVNIAQKDKLEENRKHLELNKKDVEFHSYLWNKSRSKWTKRILSNLHYQLKLAMISDYKLEENLVAAAKIHYRILNQLKNGDLEKVIKTVKAHIISYNQELMNKIG